MQSLIINSKDRGTQNLNDFFIRNQLNIGGADYWAIDRVFMTKNIYDVNPLTNSITTAFNDGVNTETNNITIAKGNYTAVQLASAVQTALNTASAGNGYATTYTCTYNSTTSKFTITPSVAGNLQTITGTLAPLMGYNQTTLNIGAFTSTFPANISYSQFINFTSDYLMKYTTPNLKTDLVGPAYIYSVNTNYYPFGSSVKEVVRNLKYIRWSRDERIDGFDIKVYDDKNNLCEMENSEFIIVVNFYQEERED